MRTDLHPLLLAQHGVVTRRQCFEAGLTRHQVDRLLNVGQLSLMFGGVLRDPSRPGSVEQLAMGAVLAGGPTSLASHRLALAVRGVRNFSAWIPEISSMRRVSREGLTVHRIREPVVPELVRNVPITTAPRTLVDCGEVLSEQLLARFAEGWLSTKVVSLEQLEIEMQLAANRAAARTLARALNSRSIVAGEADSVAELELGRLLVRHGLPLPALHHVVTVASGSVYELDWSYPNRMAAFEMDGYGVHLRSYGAFNGDRDRRNELVVDGWRVLNFTTAMLRRNPRRILDQVRRLIA